MRMGCPESPYTPSYADYKKEIIIPHILAGGMCGLHAAITLVGIIAIGKLSFARIQKWRQNKKTDRTKQRNKNQILYADLFYPVYSFARSAKSAPINFARVSGSIARFVPTLPPLTQI